MGRQPSTSSPRSSPADAEAEHWLLGAYDVCADVGQRRAELLAGADPELAEHLAQVPLHCARAEEELGADLGIRLPVRGYARDLRLLRGQVVERLNGALAHRLAGGLQLATRAVR